LKSHFPHVSTEGGTRKIAGSEILIGVAGHRRNHASVQSERRALLFIPTTVKIHANRE
jgi:hypothetical protein